MDALKSQATGQPASDLRLAWGTGLLLAAVTLAVFWPVVHCQFLNYDDPKYITENRHVLTGLTVQNAVWAFRATYASNWHPLTWLTHMLDVALFGPGPLGPHVTNWLLHAANTVLVFVALRRLTGAHWRSALVAVWFGLHPLHVESVAWVSERKDLLSAFFGLLTFWAYARYVECGMRKTEDRRQKTEGGRQKTEDGRQKTDGRWQMAEGSGQQSPSTINSPTINYLLSLCFFALGLMSKPMLVTLPFVLLLLDYWPLQRFKASAHQGCCAAPLRLLLEKVPFFVLSAICSVVTFLVQRQGGAVVSLQTFPLCSRLGNALVAYARYLGKTIWPVNLAVFYPRPLHWSWVWVCAALALVAGLTWLAWRARRRLPFALTGWLWFLGMLVPVIGLVQVGPQALADRYSYLPLIGLFIILAWGGAALRERWSTSRFSRLALATVAALTVVACGARTRDQLRHWRDSGALFTHALAVTRNNGVALGCLGQYEQDHGRVDEAIKLFEQSRAVGPYGAAVLSNLGNALAERGRTEEAVAQFREALEMEPDSERVLNNLGNLLVRLGRVDEAVADFRRALALNPDLLEAHKALALALAQRGSLEEATRHFREALRLQPGDPETLNNLGSALARRQRTDEAIESFRQALQLAPGFADARKNLGLALLRKERPEEALEQFRQALRLKADDADTLNYLGAALARLDRRDEAIESFRQALKVNPNHADARRNLSRLTQPAEVRGP